MADYDDLIARLESAEGPDRELDEAIAYCIGWYSCPPALTSRTNRDIWFDPDGGEFEEVPEFTGSLDAAMELMPKGLPWMISTFGPHAGFDAAVGIDDSRAKTPACTLSAAALKARKTVATESKADDFNR